MFRLTRLARAAAVTAAVSAAGVAAAQTPADLPPIPVPAAAEPAAPVVVDAAPAAACDACASAFDWKNVPVTRAVPKLGNFPIPPTGPGFYSLWDHLRGEELQGPPKYPYPRFGLIPPSFFDMNFSYLDNPKNTEHDYADPLKRVRLGDNWLLSTGGDVRNRYETKDNDRLTTTDNTYNLSRVRAYTDLWYKDLFRLYAEGIGAWSAGEELAPVGIDENYADFLNLFIDVKVAELRGKPAYVRVGRQELLFGSQRLVSTLDWANTRRTFQGVRGLWQGEKVTADVFWVQPVPPNRTRFDSVDNNVNFAGAFTTTKVTKDQSLDLYYFLLDNTNPLVQQGINRGNSTLNTAGARYHGTRDNFLFDAEGGVQLGSVAGQSAVAGFATAGGGYNWKGAPLNPTFWAYYDYASGDNDPNAGTANTFNQLFPFGHYYLGWIDLVGRQNIHDLNFHLYLYPAKWATVWVQYHRFWLASPRDALYNAAGNAIRRDASGAAGTDVGREVDVVANFHLTKHADLLTGYSHLFGGDFLKATSGPNRASSADFFFVQMSYRW